MASQSDNLSLENRQSIQKQLEMLGFANAGDIVKTATHPFNLINSGDPPVRAMMMQDMTSDADRMYSFIVAESEMNKWYIREIEGAGFVRGLKKLDGILSEPISYNVQNRTLPNKDQIIKDIDKATRVQEIRYRFKSVPSKGKSNRHKL